jgi:hypothetical protein
LTENTTQAAASTRPDNTDFGNASIEDAAKSIEALLSGEADKRKAARNQAAQAATSEAIEAEEEAHPEVETAETAPEADEPEDAAEDTSPEAPEEDAEDSDAEEPLYTVKINGKDEQVPLSELLSGYSRTSDYHQKTQALSQEKKSFQAEIEQVKQERAQYAQLLPALAQQIQSAMPQPPSLDLLEADPVQYLRQKEIHEREAARLQAAMSEMQRAQQLNSAEQQKAIEQMVTAAREKLPELIPAWKDPKAYERDRTAMRGFLEKAGYSKEEIDQAYDPRAVALAWKAMRYDELTSKKLTPTAPPLQKAPPAAASAPPASSQNSARRAGKEARSRLAQTGRIDDAAAAIRALL